jgi:GTP-binding protein
MKFVDEVQVTVKAGDGGRGCVSFRREKFQPRGGPDGGDGGDGGSVVFRVDDRLGTLFDFKLQRHLRARRGEHGRGSACNGARGNDLEVLVPPGTLVTNIDTGEVMADLTDAGTSVVVARGGRGGRGNRHFATPSHQAPRRAEPGRPGAEHRLRLELRLLADVGLIGKPNAGKSTLLRALSAARPRVAAYPFTTLVPHLGVISEEDHHVIVADIPGLIEGAHDGAGLGIRFLRHVSRTAVLAHLIDASGTDGDPVRNFDAVNAELASYDATLVAKPQVVVATKIDLPAAQERLADLRDTFARRGISLHPVSAVEREGTDELASLLCRRVAQLRLERTRAAETAHAVDAAGAGTAVSRSGGSG